MSVRNIASPPSRLNFARELFAGLDMVGVPKALLRSPGKTRAPSRQYPVMVLPGFGGGDASTVPLRQYLSRNGFEAYGWGMGTNQAGRNLEIVPENLAENWNADLTRTNKAEYEVPTLINTVADMIRDKAEALGTKFHLVGWSLGGYIAREIARDLPDHIQSVVTMGSPVFGGPKYTSTAGLFRARNLDLDWIEDNIEKRFERPITQPVTIIYSKRDGIVGWQAAKDHLSPDVTHAEVNVSHIGLGLNAQVWRIMLEALSKNDC